MAVAAFADPAAPRGQTTSVFSAAGAAARTMTRPLQALATDRPGPHRSHKARARGARSQADNAIGQAVGAREQAIRRRGLADRVNDQASGLFNPAKDMLVMAAAAVPGLAPVMGAVAGRGVYNYYQADRNSGNDNYDADTGVYVRADMSEDQRRTSWNQPGFHILRSADNDDLPPLTEAEIDELLAPLSEQPHMRVLFARRADIEDAEVSLAARERNGLPRNAQTVAAALRHDADMTWVHKNTPAPAYI